MNDRSFGKAPGVSDSPAADQFTTEIPETAEAFYGTERRVGDPFVGAGFKPAPTIEPESAKGGAHADVFYGTERPPVGEAAGIRRPSPMPPDRPRRRANRANAVKSTGPRTARGKAFSSLNAVRHGLSAQASLAAGPGRRLMEALGEDPREFQALSQRLLADWQPRTETARQLVAELAELFWKQTRLARAEQAVAALQVEELESSRGALGAEIGRAHCRSLDSRVRVGGLWWLPDSPGKFEDVITMLTLLRREAEARRFSGLCQTLIKLIWGMGPTLEGEGIRAFFEKLSRKSGAPSPDGAASVPTASAAAPTLDSNLPVPPPAPDEAGETEPLAQAAAAGQDLSDLGVEDDLDDCDALLSILDREIRHVRDAYQFYQRAKVEITPALRASQLAPIRPEWLLLNRQRTSVFRQIDRTLKLLMELQTRARDERSSPPAGAIKAPSPRPAVQRTKNCKTKPTGPLESVKTIAPHAAIPAHAGSGTPRNAVVNRRVVVSFGKSRASGGVIPAKAGIHVER